MKLLSKLSIVIWNTLTHPNVRLLAIIHIWQAPQIGDVTYSFYHAKGFGNYFSFIWTAPSLRVSEHCYCYAEWGHTGQFSGLVDKVCGILHLYWTIQDYQQLWEVTSKLAHDITVHGSVPNHQPHDCLLSRLFRRRSKKTSKLRVTGLCAVNSLVTGEFPGQMASNVENVSIWLRNRGWFALCFLVNISWNWNVIRFPFR